ncbi:MAG TPA: hypothetical protein VER79_09820 [Candidatus Limnocylindrales bacterium]|nr:hypothetical protein [Candidatus Limnocylindrales bacterium]
MTDPALARCPSCDGYGWLEEDDGTAECAWCAGAGYVTRDADGIDRAIPAADYGRLAAQLEALEAERLRELGYSGAAKKPWEQEIRLERKDGLAQRGAPSEGA